MASSLPSPSQEPRAIGLTTLRQILLVLVLFTTVGLLVELVLLAHYDSFWQWTPLALLVLAAVSSISVWWAPSRSTVRPFRWVMGLCVLAGALGLYLHYRGNLEFELESDPGLHGFALFWETVTGATPTLAPGAMTQLGLLGLAFAYRHPALRAVPPVRRDGADDEPQEIQ